MREGHFGHVPESLDEKAFQLLRLLAANHPFVDSNKRTALTSVRAFYALDGVTFDYDREIKEILKDIATYEADVPRESVVSYLRKHTEPLAPEYATTIELWSARVEDLETSSDEIDSDPSDFESQERPNDSDGDDRSEAVSIVDDEQSEVPEEMSPEEARRWLVRFLARQDYDEHEEIHQELAKE